MDSAQYPSPVSPSMSPTLAAAAKENARLNNSASATKSRVRKTMAIVEGSAAAKAYGVDVAVLGEMVSEAERLVGRRGLGAEWELVRDGVLERHGRSSGDGWRGGLLQRD